MKWLKVINWEQYQQYKDRNPPWIKLHRDILTSRSWILSNDNQRVTMIVLMLLAARNSNLISNNPEYIRRVAHMDETPDIEHLIRIGFCEETDVEERRESPWPSRYVSKDVRSQVFSRDNNQCVFCGSKQSLELDHIIPISKGGDANPKNLQVLCRKCNRKKRTRTANATQSVATATQATDEAYSETETEERQKHNVERFDQFWITYPRKVGKGAARKAWAKLHPSEELTRQILEAVEQQKKSTQWIKNGGQYIPNPATWLNQERWQDSAEIERPPPPIEDPTPKEKRREIVDRNGDRVVMEWQGKFGWQEIERSQA